jgi:ribosomal 30S subunit maturation factor RimM
MKLIAKLILTLEKIHANYKLTVSNGDWVLWGKTGNMCNLNGLIKVSSHRNSATLFLGEKLLIINKNEWKYVEQENLKII